jgi:hypothetical protein
MKYFQYLPFIIKTKAYRKIPRVIINEASEELNPKARNIIPRNNTIIIPENIGTAVGSFLLVFSIYFLKELLNFFITDLLGVIP